MDLSCRVAVVGGGAAGFFAAIAVAEAGGGPVVILEKSSSLLAKVKISGGGRCNVTHACFDPALLVTRYPRGSRELLGPMRRFGPRDTAEWFEGRGVPLKTEADGRMFPTTDHSETVIRCLLDAAAAAGVQILTRAGLQSVERTADDFHLTLEDGRAMTCAKLILATGTSRAANIGGPAIARAFGHAVSEPVPSLFTFNIPDERLHGLAGVSVPAARVRVPGTSLDETGPVARHALGTERAGRAAPFRVGRTRIGDAAVSLRRARSLASRPECRGHRARAPRRPRVGPAPDHFR